MDLNEMMKAMMIALNSSGKPCAGIFWYLPEEHDLFEVHSIPPPNEQEHIQFQIYTKMCGKNKSIGQEQEAK